MTNPAATLGVKWNNQKGCTNSYIDLTKSTGTWGGTDVYGATGTLVNDITSSLSSFTTASSPASVIYTSTGWKNVSTATDSRDRLLYITTNRVPPVILGLSTPICMDASLTISCTPNSPSTVVAYEWTIQATPVTDLTTPTAIYTSTAASFTYAFPNATGADITYQIKLRVQDQCCGWSKPVFGSVTVKPQVTVGTIGTDKTICYNTAGPTLSNVVAPANIVGTPTYKWFYKENCTGSWIEISGATSATYITGTLTNTRCYYREMTNCSYVLNSNIVTITVYNDFDPGSVLPDHEGICTGSIPGTKYMSTAPSGGSGVYSYQWFYKDGVGNTCPTGTATTGWTTIGGATANTYTPPALVSDRTYALQVDAKGTPDCAPATWASNCVVDTIHLKPKGTPSLYKLYQCDMSAILKADNLSDDTSTINWTRTASASSPGTSSDNPLLVTGLVGGVTSTYKLEMTNKWCPNILVGSVNIIPVANTPGTIAKNTGTGFVCSSCIIPDGITKTYYDVTGKIIGKIEDDGVVTPDYLDSTEVCVNVVSTTMLTVPTILDNFGLNQPYLARYWTISPKNYTNSIVTLYFTNTELTNLQSFATSQSPRYQFSGYNLYVTKFPGGGGGTFTPPCTGHCASGAVSVPSQFGWDAAKSLHYVTFTINSFSTFYIHPALFPFAPLPVELISFTGWNEGAVNKLQWKTASEKNTVRFEVEKSLESSVWTAIGDKPASGNSTIERSYDFNDNNPVIGNNYYRLKIIDNDGTFNYSNVINIPISTAIINSFVQVYPNPTTGILNIDIQSTSAYDIRMTTMDVLGKKVLEKPMSIVKGLNTLTIDYSILAKGAYVLQYLDSEGKIHNAKFVKD